MPDFKLIRSWQGSQDRAFEELCFQLRDPTPARAELIRPGSPDAGYEWYVRHQNCVEWGWQVKFTDNIDDALKLMEKSLKTVADKRPDCRRLTFCLPFNLPDARVGREQKSAQQKFEDRKESWRRRIKGADRIRIELWPASTLLERLAAHPNERGISWFFWKEEVFAPEWLAKRMAITTAAAGARYSPELHVELPVAFALEGLGDSQFFRERYTERRRAVAARMERRASAAGLGVGDALRAMRERSEKWLRAVPERPPLGEHLDRDVLIKLSTDFGRTVADATPELPPKPRRETTRQRARRERIRALQSELWRLGQALDDFTGLLRSPAGKAAATGTLLITGEAGQGKTHLLCDAGKRALAEGRPAIVLLGGLLSGNRFWSDCAERLGLGQVGGEVLLGAMRAAAEASAAPCLLLVDALNESAHPSGWRAELPALLAELNGDPWISLGVSLRSGFEQVVLPPEGLTDVPAVRHPGFRGRELEATERFFDAYGLEQPRVPLLTPEFTNPLFLKLYCEGLHQLGLSAPPAGEAHISDVFARHLEWKSRVINATLELDPARRSVERALDDISAAMVAAGRDTLSRERAEQLADAHAPGPRPWPRTMFGQLLNEGLLAADVSWAADEPDVIRFQYQRFADYRVASSLLEPFVDADALRAALAPKKPFRATLLAAPSGWVEALAVLVPERFGIELLDASSWRLDDFQRRIWLRAHVRSAMTRRPATITAGTRKWLQKAERENHSLNELVFELLMTVAPIPDHPLNADHLHGWLMRQPLADRDAGFGRRIYYALGTEEALDRLIRWAARGPYPEAPDEVLRLATTAIAWTFSSPNRFLRDYATKALRQLVASRLPVLAEVLAAFAGVDDPYVSERLAVVAHGCLLTGGRKDPDGALRAARTLRDRLFAEDPVPNMLTRDAVRGCFEWLLHAGLIDNAEYEPMRPPYGSEPPGPTRSKEEIEAVYWPERRDADGNYLPTPYGSLFISLFDLGDFGRYVADAKLRDFTDVPLDHPAPRRARPTTPAGGPAAEEVAAEVAKLTTEELEQLLSELHYKEAREPSTNVPEPSREPPLRRDPRYPGGSARSWIFERVLELGWTPERFGEFEHVYLRGGASRSSHKPERFGKKYQWIALRELVARVADNFHMRADWEDEPRPYEGPWQFYGRDIDPTLPPAARYRDEDDDTTKVGSTFNADPSGTWWQPAGPRFLASDPLPPDDWATQPEHIPRFADLVRRTDPDGTRWLTLQAYYNWDEERLPEEERGSRPRRDIWSHIYSWLVPVADLNALTADLAKRSFMGRWMPESGTLTNAAYLGELLWAEAANEYPREWEPVRPRRAGSREFKVFPAWDGYNWEGGGRDCSLEQSVGSIVPAQPLLEAGAAIWVPSTRSWADSAGELVAQYREGGNHSALLVRESWLKPLLNGAGWGVLVGWLGEKQLFSGGWSPGLIGDWTEMNGVATFRASGWKIAAETSTIVNERTAGDA